MINALIYGSLIFLVGMGCGVLLARAREHDRARQKLRADEEVRKAYLRIDGTKYETLADRLGGTEHKTFAEKLQEMEALRGAAEALQNAPYRRPLAEYGQVSKWPSPKPEPNPASSWRFRGKCRHCGTENIYALGDVVNDWAPPCTTCGKKKTIFHSAHTRIAD